MTENQMRASAMFLMLGSVCACAGCGTSSTEEISLPQNYERMHLAPPAIDSWPWWRGRNHDGISQDHNVPVEWSEEKNIAWRVQVHGQGHSSPIIVGSQIFLTTSDINEQTQSVVSFDRNTGRQNWTTVVHRSGMSAPLHSKATYADSTIASSGDQLFAVFLNDGALHVTSIGMTGNIDWQTKVGPFQTQYGYGASPVIYRSFVVIAGGGPSRGFLVAVHRRTGKIMWRVQRNQTEGGNYATPTLASIDGKSQLLINGTGLVCGYDPGNGELLWSIHSPAKACCNTMAFGPDYVYASGGTPEKKTLCINPKLTLESTDDRVVWSSDRSSETSYVPSLLFDDGSLFNLNDQGIITCFDGSDGSIQWQRRLRGNFSASPVSTGGRIYACSEDGVTYVLSTADDGASVATNELNGRFFATPAICGNSVYLRTTTHLYRIHEGPSSD